MNGTSVAHEQRQSAPDSDQSRAVCTVASATTPSGWRRKAAAAPLHTVFWASAVLQVLNRTNDSYGTLSHSDQRTMRRRCLHALVVGDERAAELRDPRQRVQSHRRHAPLCLRGTTALGCAHCSCSIAVPAGTQLCCHQWRLWPHCAARRENRMASVQEALGRIFHAYCPVQRPRGQRATRETNSNCAELSKWRSCRPTAEAVHAAARRSIATVLCAAAALRHRRTTGLPRAAARPPSQSRR